MTIEQFLNTIKANQKGIENLSCDLLSKNCIFDLINNNTTNNTKSE